MATDTLSYPLDTTGVSPNNKVVGEPHDLAKDLVLRVVAPKYGAFYKAGLVVVDAATGTPLTYGVQYYVAYRYDVPSARFKKNVCGLIVITDTDIKSVFLNYQAVGAGFSKDAQTIADMLALRVSNNRNDAWAPLLDPVENLPDEDLLYYQGAVSTSQQLVMAINRFAAARVENDPAYMMLVKKYVTEHANTIAADSAASVQQQITDHIADLTAHPQYARIADINSAVPMVRKPVNVSPIDGAVGVSRLSFTMTTAGYYGLYEIAQNAAQFQVSKNSDFTNIVFDTLFPTATTSGQFTGALDLGVRYYWRCRYRNVETVWGEWSDPTSFVSTTSGIATPVMTTPANGSAGLGETPTLATNAFGIIGGTDTHVSTDWVITDSPQGNGTVIWSSLNDSTNKVQIAVPAGKLKVSTTYYARARHNSAANGSSAWTADAMFSTGSAFLPVQLGAVYQGGYYGGLVHIGTKDYVLVVAPKATESSLALQNPASPVVAYDDYDSKANTTALLAANSPAATYVRGLNTGTFTDWQLPSRGVLAQMANNLSPISAAVTAAFKTGGAEAFSSLPYWSSTVVNDGSTAYRENLATNATDSATRTSLALTRAIRLVDVSTLVSEPALGSAYQGGFYAGRIMEDGVLYELIVAPKATGETSLMMDTSSVIFTRVTSEYDGSSNTKLYGTSTGTAAALKYAIASTIGGFTDWYVPSVQELDVLYRAFKPGTDANTTGTRAALDSAKPDLNDQMGYNPFARPSGDAYTTTAPAQSGAAAYQTGGAEAFSRALYWSSTYNSINPMTQSFINGAQAPTTKNTAQLLRLVRKVKVVSPPKEVPNGVIGSAFAGGFYAGNINDGFCNYALVVSPRDRGNLSGMMSAYDINTVSLLNGISSRKDGYGNTKRILLAYGTITTTGNTVAADAAALRIAGYTDWYIPAADELEILYRNFKPTSDANYMTAISGQLNPGGFSGVNTSSNPAGAKYSAQVPAMTTLPNFAPPGAQRLNVPADTFGSLMVSSTCWAAADQDGDGNVYNSFLNQSMQNGQQGSSASTVGTNFRAMRRVALDTPITEAALADVPTVPGTPWAGGSYVGRVVVAGVLYALVVSPKGLGEASLKWKTTAVADVGSYGDLVDGWKNTNQFVDALHPAASWARSLNISGCTDWYLPARDEVEVMYRYLKSTSAANYTAIDRVDAKTSTSTSTAAHGTNDNSVPTGTRYLANTPAMTTSAPFVFNTSLGLEYIFNSPVCSSTVNTTNVVDGPLYTWIQNVTGRQYNLSIATAGTYRAVRRVKINS